MSCVPEVDFNKIIYCYHDLGEKKLLKKSLSGLNINKKVFLFYARNSHVPKMCIRDRSYLFLKQAFK